VRPKFNELTVVEDDGPDDALVVYLDSGIAVDDRPRRARRFPPRQLANDASLVSGPELQ
jgi:hypothetical protein